MGDGPERAGSVPELTETTTDRAADPVELATDVALVAVVSLESSEPGAKR
jgi:hypothetical protein